MKTKAKNAILQAIEILNARQYGNKYAVEHIRKDTHSDNKIDWGFSVFQKERTTDGYDSMISDASEIINLANALGINQYITVDTYDVPDDVVGTKNKPCIRLF